MTRSPQPSRRETTRSASSRRASRRRLFTVETFESRTLLSTIVWSNMGSAMSDTDSFNAIYGTNAAAARTIVQTAIQAWEQVIQNFNYANVGTPGNAPTANTYTLNISAADLGGGGRGVTNTNGIDSAGKPFSSNITLDDDGGGAGWYFDANPNDNAEFTSLLNRFTSTFTTGSGNDFYRTIVHEMGHAMGIALNSSLAIVTGGFLTPAGTDQNDSTANLQLFTGATTSATFTSNGGGHIYEGPADPAFPGNPLNPFDLMNAGRTIGPPPTRELITDLDANILRDAYGYTITTPSTIQTFLANFNTTTGELTINGDVTTNQAGTRTFLDDVIAIDLVGANLRVGIDGLTPTFPFASVTSWKVLSTGGNDQITIDFVNGSPIPAGGASVDGGPPSTLPGDSLTIINQPLNAPVVFTPSTTGPTNPGSIVVGGGASISFVAIETLAFASPIHDFTYLTPPGADDLTIDSPGPGQNRITGTNNGATLFPFSFSNITNFTIDTNIGADVVTVESPGLIADGLQNFAVKTGNDDDTLIIESGVLFNLPVAGGAFTYDAGVQATPDGDNLIVHAPGASVGEFRPDGATANAGRFIKDGTTLVTTRLERAVVDGFADFALITPNDGDAMTITPAPVLRNRIAGSSGGVDFSALTFYDVNNFLIDSRTNNVGGLLGDRYAIDNPGGPALQASGLRNFTIRSSAGDDVLTINANDFRLPVAGGEFLFDAGTGHYDPSGIPGSNLRGLISFDRIVINADVDYLVNDVGPFAPDRTPAEGLLSIASSGAGSTPLGAIRLIGVEAAALTGGASGNRMDGSGFSGTLILSGGDGDDRLMGGSGHNELNAGGGDDLLIAGYDPLAHPGVGSQNQTVFRGGGTNILRGGAGRNTFRVDINGTATLIGGSGENLYDIVNPPGGVVDPVGGITIEGAGKPTDVLRLEGGGGAGYNQTYLLGPTPGAGNIVTTNNHVPDGPTISQFIRFSGIGAIDDSITADHLIFVGESAAAPIGGITSADLAAGVVNPTVGGLPFGSITFANKTVPMAQLADGQVVTLPPPPSPLVIAPAPPVAAPAPLVATPSVAPEPVVAVVPAPVPVPAPIVHGPARRGLVRPLARRIPAARTAPARPTPVRHFAIASTRPPAKFAAPRLAAMVLRGPLALRWARA